MEETLKIIIDKLDRLEEGQTRLLEGQTRLEEGQTHLFEGQNNLESRQINLEEEQKEMRKESGFYYGSMMRKLEEFKTEFKSDFNHLASTQRQYQDLLELLNRKQ